MHDSEGLAFLKEQSILDKTLKNLVSVCKSVQSAFDLLDTQFGDKEAELRIIKSHICNNPMLTYNYDFGYQIEVVKRFCSMLPSLIDCSFPKERTSMPLNLIVL